MDAANLAKNIQGDIIRWRRDLHRIPGTNFDIQDTYEYIVKCLEEMGIRYKTIAKTGICAVINGSEDGPVIALRADMDGLAIREETGLPFASVNGCMHACGHDAHAAMLLGAGKILSMNRDKFKGSVKLLFQPAEENEGGAKPMIDEGCLENPKVDAIVGLHIGQLFSEVENGCIGVRYGAAMASVDRFNVRVTGKGGHGAKPDLCVDPITTASEIITSLQRIISRELNPLHSAVITIGLIEGGTAFNVIPETVKFEGTVRTLDSNDREFIEKRIKEMCQTIASANRAEVEIEYIKRYPVLVNDEDFTKNLIKSAEKIVGSERIIYLNEPTMTAEDMAYYLKKVPGTYFYLGSKKVREGIVYPHHHPKFDIDEDVMWIGTAVFLQAVLDFLNRK